MRHVKKKIRKNLDFEEERERVKSWGTMKSTPELVKFSSFFFLVQMIQVNKRVHKRTIEYSTWKYSSNSICKVGA